MRNGNSTDDVGIPDRYDELVSVGHILVNPPRVEGGEDVPRRWPCGNARRRSSRGCKSRDAHRPSFGFSSVGAARAARRWRQLVGYRPSFVPSIIPNPYGSPAA
jgi:hypothetical protein